MKIRINDEYSNLGEDFNIILDEYSNQQQGVEDDEGYESAERDTECCNAPYYEASDNDFNVEIQYSQEGNYSNENNTKYSEYDKFYQENHMNGNQENCRNDYEEYYDNGYEKKYVEECEECKNHKIIDDLSVCPEECISENGYGNVKQECNQNYPDDYSNNYNCENDYKDNYKNCEDSYPKYENEYKNCEDSYPKYENEYKKCEESYPKCENNYKNCEESYPDCGNDYKKCEDIYLNCENDYKKYEDSYSNCGNDYKNCEDSYPNSNNDYKNCGDNYKNSEIDYAKYENNYKKSEADYEVYNNNYKNQEQNFTNVGNDYGNKYNEKCNCRKGRIEVCVKLADKNGIEIKGAKINLYELNGVCPKLYESKLTDCNGKAIFENLENGCYRVISLVDRRYFEKPTYITWNEVTIDDCVKDANICVVNKIKPSCIRR